MSRHTLYAVIFLWLRAIAAQAQDIHFSQFNENHPLINPAFTGATDAFRASVAYRDQWQGVSTPYRTSGMAFETRTNSSGWKKVDNFRSMTFKERGIGRLAWGLSVYNDKAGSSILGSTSANLSMATFVPVSKKSFISLGLQASFVQQRIDTKNLLFPSQYNGSVYDPNLPQNEHFTRLNYNYFGFAGGVLWSYGQHEKRIAANNELKGNVGISFYRIAPPHDGFFTTDRLQMKYVLHGDMLYAPPGFSHGIQPSFMVQRQGSSMEIVVGAMLRYYVEDNSKYTGNVKRSSLGYGAYYRNGDALIVCLNFEMQEQYVIGLSYDINLSQLAAVSYGRGGFEITLRYTPPKAFLYQKRPPLQ